MIKLNQPHVTQLQVEVPGDKIRETHRVKCPKLGCVTHRLPVVRTGSPSINRCCQTEQVEPFLSLDFFKNSTPPVLGLDSTRGINTAPHIRFSRLPC